MRFYVLSVSAAIILGLSIGYVTMAKVTGQNRKSQGPEIHGFDTANLDKTKNACTDFYQYAAGGWMATHPIPAAYPQWGSFVVLRDKNADVLHSILEDSARNTSAKKGST